MITLIFFPEAGSEMALLFFLAKNSLHGMMQPVPQSLLPEIKFPQSPFRIEDFNPKSIKKGEIVKKLYNFKNGRIP